MTDPFFHHPDLREKIAPAAQSFFRDMTLERLEAMLSEKGLPIGWWYDEATREGLRADVMAGRNGDDMWVFAYGSLLWDPGIEFTEVRRAHAPNHARRFILRDIYGGRGTPEAPGLMAALDDGPGCAGLVFRVPQALLEDESYILFRREMLCPGYHASFIPVEIDGAQIEALTFVADHDTDLIVGDITREAQIDYLVTGTGFLGTSFDYLKNVITHLHDMGIPDADLDALYADAHARLTALA